VLNSLIFNPEIYLHIPIMATSNPSFDSDTEALAAHSPSQLILTGRSREKVEEVITTVQARYPHVTYRFLALVLSSQNSCRTAANEILADETVPQIDIVINNAGIMNLPTRDLSEDGIEMQFATNHIGHFLFTNLIIPKLIASAARSGKGSTRIVNVSSQGHWYSPVRFSVVNLVKSWKELSEGERPNLAALGEMAFPVEDTYTPIVAYGQSKTANVLFSVALTRRLYSKHGISSYGVHPGTIITELSRHTAGLEEAIKRFKAAGRSSRR